MIPIVTPAEMAQVDAAATESVDVLIDRAGAAVAWAARRLLGGIYGRRVVVIAGRGNNGADGRVAAMRLRRWGARVIEIDAASDAEIPAADLVIDAAYGTGLSRAYQPPVVRSPVLAVDIPSGVNGLTGEILGDSLRAVETVTFQALKPGLLFPPGSDHTGEISVVDLGLDVSSARAHLITRDDVGRWLPQRAVDAHKWRTACWVIAGSQGMTGAAELAAAGASRVGAGYVRLSTPGAAPAGPIEAVAHQLPADGWAQSLSDQSRFASVIIGPGLGRSDEMAAQLRAAIPLVEAPLVLDADALAAVGSDHSLVSAREAGTVLTPHDGEYEALTGHRPGPDRIQAARELAEASGSVVLLKGPATVVSDPCGEVLVSTAGDQRLATAGSGDVLTGVIGGLLAAGMECFEAAAAASWLHGKAALSSPRHAMVASDLLAALPEVLDATYLG